MAVNKVSSSKGKILDLTETSVTIGTAQAGANLAVVPFTANASNTGGPTFSYVATSTPGSITAQASTSPITVLGLTAGTSYTFTVIAKNPSGNSIAGPSSSSNSVVPTVPAVVTGGTLYSDATYYYRAFTSNGTLSVTGNSLTYDYVVIAGGGGAGQSGFGGGGGAGGVVGGSRTVSAGTNATVTIGAGGNAGAPATNGSNTQFTGVTDAIGGGRGGANSAGGNGGSGGGGSQSGAGGTGTAGQGFNGSAGGAWYGGGGGGAGGAAVNTSGGGNGTDAYSSWCAATGGAIGQLSGSTYYLAAGGGGTYGGQSSLGGNTFGAGGYNAATGGNGGLVMIRYTRAQVGG